MILGGRIVWGITMVVISGVSGSAFTWSAFIAGAPAERLFPASFFTLC